MYRTTLAFGMGVRPSEGCRWDSRCSNALPKSKLALPDVGVYFARLHAVIPPGLGQDERINPSR